MYYYEVNVSCKDLFCLYFEHSCECNGHSDVCDKDRGDNCDCKNNTKSPRCDSSDALKSCYKLQVRLFSNSFISGITIVPEKSCFIEALHTL